MEDDCHEESRSWWERRTWRGGCHEQLDQEELEERRHNQQMVRTVTWAWAWGETVVLETAEMM